MLKFLSSSLVKWKAFKFGYYPTLHVKTKWINDEAFFMFFSFSEGTLQIESQSLIIINANLSLGHFVLLSYANDGIYCL